MPYTDPIQDSVSLIAGGSVNRTPRPGEVFEILEEDAQKRPARKFTVPFIGRLRLPLHSLNAWRMRFRAARTS